MVLSRRSFLSHSAAIGALSPILAIPDIAEALQETSSGAATIAPSEGELYWRNLYAGASHRGGHNTPNEAHDPRIMQYSEKAGLRWAEDILPSELPSFEEDAVVTMELTGFRAGSQDKSQLSKVRFAQLHLSCQRVTGSEFLGPLVWAALATVFTSKASKLPAEQNLTWGALSSQVAGQQSAQPQPSGGPRLSHIVLNQGAGHMSVNVTSTPPTSPLDRVLGGLVLGTRILSPLLGFPGIALPALQNFYVFYSQLEKARPENFLLNSAQRDVAVTQQGADNSLISTNALKLITGSYVLVPKSQEEDLHKEMDNLIVQNGYLVNRNSKAAPDDRVQEAVPTVSYVVLNVRVQPASAFPATSTVTDPMLDSSPHADGSSKSDKPQKPKKP